MNIVTVAYTKVIIANETDAPMHLDRGGTLSIENFTISFKTETAHCPQTLLLITSSD